MAGAREGLEAYFRSFPELTVSRKRVVAVGDLVAVHSHYRERARRARAGRRGSVPGTGREIVEHWDVLQDVPATSANDNTVF